MKEKEFITADVYLSSAIAILLNTQPNFKVENKKTLFVFPISDDLYEAMNSYNSGIAINICEYVETLKKMRAEMVMRRNMAGQR
jgi:hypothetical protein